VWSLHISISPQEREKENWKKGSLSLSIPTKWSLMESRTFAAALLRERFKLEISILLHTPAASLFISRKRKKALRGGLECSRRVQWGLPLQPAPFEIIIELLVFEFDQVMRRIWRSYVFARWGVQSARNREAKRKEGPAPKNRSCTELRIVHSSR
jgi:hypothetical protein